MRKSFPPYRRQHGRILLDLPLDFKDETKPRVLVLGETDEPRVEESIPPIYDIAFLSAVGVIVSSLASLVRFLLVAIAA